MSSISIVCFAASYAVALALEVSRLFFRSGVRGALLFGFAGAGLLAHTWFLASRLFGSRAAVSGWFDWYLLAAWVLACTYLYLAFYHPRNPMGIFVLPLVLGLIAVAYVFRDDTSFVASERVWGLIHGLSLLLGTVVVLVGFVAGIMYLLEASRLKRKLPPAQRFRLPSLEWTEKVNGRSLVISTILLGVGVLSGLALNAIHQAAGDRNAAVRWSDPVVWTSCLLFMWLICAVVFNIIYRPARQGRKVAYLTLASMVFLLIALGVVLFGPSHVPSQDDRRSDNGLAVAECERLAGCAAAGGGG